MSQIESFGWIIYIMENWKPHFLIIKRQALSKKIEWTAPKGKAETNEKPVETAKREIMEETGINPDLLVEKWLLWDFMITFPDSNFSKKVTYFLFEYKWDKNNVKISDTEGYIWVYNWLPIESILNLVPYRGLRELYRKGYQKLTENKND